MNKHVKIVYNRLHYSDNKTLHSESPVCVLMWDLIHFRQTLYNLNFNIIGFIFPNQSYMHILPIFLILDISYKDGIRFAWLLEHKKFEIFLVVWNPFSYVEQQEVQFFNT